ncbi:MAG: glycosyltransferase family 4 protein [Ignavibacteriaceae bacterium]
MIRILHLQNYINISCGVSKTIYLIQKNTSPNFHHTLACFGGDGISRFNPLDVRPLILKDYKFFSLKFILHSVKLFTYCKKNKINIIHSHHRYFDFLSYLVSKFLNVKTITSVHSKVHDKKMFSYKADVLIACSNAIKYHLINNFKIAESRISIIYNPVDSDEVLIRKTMTNLLDELKIPEEKLIIGYVGRLNFKEKGVDILLKAFQHIIKDRNDFHLIIMGNGIDKKNIEYFIAISKIPATLIEAQEDVYDYINLFDVFVLPSRIESFGMVILEAGLMKKTVIASNVDGIPEIIDDGENGLLFESGNSIDLGNKILKIIDDKKLANQLAENLNKKVLQQFTVQKIIPEYERLYLELYNGQ